MPTGARLERLIRESDAVLRNVDASTVTTMRRHLRSVLVELENELGSLYRQARAGLPPVTGIDYRQLAEVRAREIIGQVNAQLAAFDLGAEGTRSYRALRSAARAGYVEGTKNAASLIREYEPLLARSVQVNTRGIAALVQNNAQRLSRYTPDFRERVTQAVIDGMVRGEGYRAVTIRVREATGILESRAETIARTSVIDASDMARRETYQEAGIDLVQRIATEDDRVCGYCAARAGNVYPVDEAPAVLHPNDRCFNAPFKREWVEDGLVDEDWFKRHADETIERSKDGRKTGAAPFETEAPQAVWTPKSGFLR